MVHYKLLHSSMRNKIKIKIFKRSLLISIELINYHNTSFKFERFSDFKSHSKSPFGWNKITQTDRYFHKQANLFVIILSGFILDKFNKLFMFNYAVQSYETCSYKCCASWICEMSPLLKFLKLYQKQID